MQKTCLLTLCTALISVGAIGCSDRAEDVVAPGAEAPEAPGTTTPGTPMPDASAASDDLTMASDQSGTAYVADAAGTAVYTLMGDNAGEKCVDACLEVWPPVLISGSQPGVEAGLQPNLVSIIQRPDGSRQVTYGNHPIYRYAGDSGAGRTTGQGVQDQWGEWHLLSPQGEPLPAAE